MDCSQILPGAVNAGPCSMATGSYVDNPFIVYASGKDVVILDGQLTHLQTLLGSHCGYGDTTITCLHCAEATGKIAVAWGADVVIFEAEPLDETVSIPNFAKQFPGRWSATLTLPLDYTVLSLSFNREGSQLLAGGDQITLHHLEAPPHPHLLTVPERAAMGGGGPRARELWRRKLPLPVIHLKFSPDGALFASASENDCLIKLWSPVLVREKGGHSLQFSFVYITHPRAITGFVWRKTSAFMPRGSVANVLLTYCKDNICRLWTHSLSTEKKQRLRFFIAASIDPVADIPFRSTMPINDKPFILHWLNNKDTTFTSKAEKMQRGALKPMSRHNSVASFSSSLNEEVLQSWVCIDDHQQQQQQPPGPSTLDAAVTGGGGKASPSSYLPSDSNAAVLKSMLSSNFSPHLSPLRPSSAAGGREAGGMASPYHEGKSSDQWKAFSQLMDEWCNSPDLLLCIHPNIGSLMVWTVEGIDSPFNASRLVHISFSSCLPHVFPPHLAQSLRQELHQLLIKEPDVVTTREMASCGSVTDISLPVPQIRLPSGGNMSDMDIEDVPKTKPDSTLILVSSHLNGSLNTWSVELTVQSNFCTSIAGLIHCGGTGGHHSQVRAIHRHPWLPVLMTVSADLLSAEDNGASAEKEEGRSEERSILKEGGGGYGGGGVESELIIWNADLPGPLEHKSRLNELSRMTSSDPLSFRYVAWVPPISVGGANEGAFARCPSSGLFIANVGKELRLYQSSLYCITKPQPSQNQTSGLGGPPPTASRSESIFEEEGGRASSGGLDVTVTSQLGREGISIVNVVEKDLSKMDEIVSLHAFRMCSLITSFEIKKSLDSSFCRDIVVVLVENKTTRASPPSSSSSSSSSPSSSSQHTTVATFLHVWRITICSKCIVDQEDSFTSGWSLPPPSPSSSSSSSVPLRPRSQSQAHLQPIVYTATVEKVYFSSLPLPSGTHVVGSSPASDIASSLQLQLPTLSSPFLFSTACSDGTVRCWQFSVGSAGMDRSTPVPCGCELRSTDEKLDFELYEVFQTSDDEKQESVLSQTRYLNCYEEEAFSSLPLKSFVPCGLSSAYAGRFSMAHQLTRAVVKNNVTTPLGSSAPSLSSSISSLAGPMKGANPLDQHAVVSVWECESSGGSKWTCEATLPLSGLAQIADSSSAIGVLMEWLPMENGAYLLATCFSSVISIFGMALPPAEEQFTATKKMSGFLMPKRATLSKTNSQASWVCLIQFPCAKPYLGVSTSCFAYTGNNSLVISVGSEMHLYSCWAHKSKLQPLTASKKDQPLGSKAPSRMFRESLPPEPDASSTDADIVNLLDYAHARNTPLPQYHPKILIEVMNSGKLYAVKSILVNLVKYLLLYEEKKRKNKPKSYLADDVEDYDELYGGSQEGDGRVRLLSVSADGHLKRSRKVEPKTVVESIPQIPLSVLGIVTQRKDGGGGGGGSGEGKEDGTENASTQEGNDDYDDLFGADLANPKMEELRYGFEEEIKGIVFTDLDPTTCDFSPEMAQKLSKILQYVQLADLSDVEQVRLLAIAETVANTNMSFTNATSTSMTSSKAYDSPNESGLTSQGAGYASTNLLHGVRGGEAMDDCGLRYLLALENYLTLSKSLPKGVSAGSLSPSDFVWAFHSDAESELLAAVPCVLQDDLNWPDLRNVGVGWWLRSCDTLRRLIEKLAKTQFMQQQDPLDASLFYLAMKKRTLLKGLFKTVSDHRMMTFFSNNFREPRWKKAALKNAFALLGKQRFEHAAAFFLLADKLWDAVEVCVSRLGDMQLAFVITRLYEGDNGPVYRRLLKECVLGTPAELSKSAPSSLVVSPDAFLRSMAHWLLQQYSGALETLLLAPELTSGKTLPSCSISPNPSIFNFYFFLRSHPLLIRRDYRSQTVVSSFAPSSLPPSSSSSSSHHHHDGSHALSSVGGKPLTPSERHLLFSTAYHHLCHGCPLLALDVLSRLPKSSDLGVDICGPCSNISTVDKPAKKSAGKTVSSSTRTQDGGGGGLLADRSLAGMIQSGTLGGEFSFGSTLAGSASVAKADYDEDDWSQPVRSTQSKEDNDIDWSQSFLSPRLDSDDSSDSPPLFNGSNSNVSPPDRGTNEGGGGGTGGGGEDSQDGAVGKPTTLSARGLFILSLAEQLQYNACLSILTEELNTVHIPACCKYLWDTKGKEALPLLPLARHSDGRNLVVQYEENAFEKTVLSLRERLVEWLKGETKIVKEICGFDISLPDAEDGKSKVVEETTPAGYDLLTTLMNYTSLHATHPSLVTIKLELMHLMNTLLPWSTGTSPPPPSPLPALTPESSTDVAAVDVTSTGRLCAVDPAQLPILTSCSLPAKHLTNLALHLRLMSASIVETLASHTCPPVSSTPLPHVAKVFDLCCAISHCITTCLSPMRFSELTQSLASKPDEGSGASPTSSSSSSSAQPAAATSKMGRSPKGPRSPKLPRSRGGSGDHLSTPEMARKLGAPNTKPSKWPGVPKWPNTLNSDEGKDPTPLSVVLVESLVSVYLGLLSVAWSWHSISDLKVLLVNAPSSQQTWYSTFGGGVEVKKTDEKTRQKTFLMQKVDDMTRKFKLIRRSSIDLQGSSVVPGLFISPRRTLLEHYLSQPHPSPSSSSSVGGGLGGELVEGGWMKVDSDSAEYTMEEGPMFRLGSVTEEPASSSEHSNPDCFAWCLINLCITKLVQAAVRKVLNTAGLEVLELVTASPLLYSTLKVLDEWESIFARRLDALGAAPEDLLSSRDSESPMFQVGPALTRHKFILEPEHSPFRSSEREAKEAKDLWSYLVHQEDVREVFIQYIYSNKRIGSIDDEEPDCKIVYKESDSIMSSFCFNSSARANTTVMAIALPREVIEIEVLDTATLEAGRYTDDFPRPNLSPPKRSQSMVPTDNFVMIQAAAGAGGMLGGGGGGGSMKKNQSVATFNPNFSRNSLASLTGLHMQTGCPSSMLNRRNVPGVKKMAPHPSLAYYLTGSLDGSVVMWEFGTTKPVSIQRQPGMGGSVTKIRFTPQGNKYGVTDASGKLHLWQAIHSSAKEPFQMLQSGMRHLSDFLFLGSSSLIATCGDAIDQRNLCLWDTLLPTKRSIVKEFICHESGASSLGYSWSKQRLFCGGKKGEVCVFDVRQFALLQCLPLHSSAVTCITVNDVEGYVVTGSADGDIKVLDLTSLGEVAFFQGEHAKSRLFRHSESGVTDMHVLPGNKLFTCGADGTIRSRTLRF